MEKKMYKKEEPIQYETYEMGIVLPRKFLSNGPGWGLGGVCDKNNCFVESSSYHGGWIDHGGIYQWDEEKYVDETIVYFGLFFKHWGHFLVDLNSRLWFPAISNKFTNQMKIAYIGEDEIDGNYLEYFHLLGIQKEQLIHVTQPTRFNKVIVPHFSMRGCIWFSNEYEKMLDKLISNALIEINDKEKISCEKVYFSRLNLRKAVLTEVGEAQIVKMFSINNYTVLSPETLSLKQQIYIWNTCQQIVCINGSIALNCMFSKNIDLHLVVLNKTSLIHLNLDLFILMRNTDIYYINIYKEPYLTKNIPSNLGSGPFLMEISDDLLKFFANNNLVNPYKKIMIFFIKCVNRIRYTWKVWNIKNKIKLFLQKLYIRKRG